MTVATDRGLLLPEGTRLVHIGPHKTGTTSLQSAFHANRAAASAQGVHYAGRSSQSVAAVTALTGRPQVMYGTNPPPIKLWHDLVNEIQRAREPRVVLSSEFLCEASPQAISTIVNELDPARVHIAVTLRPLSRILASQWQQFVQAGAWIRYDDWLVAMFDRKTEGQAPVFWRRHRHDELIDRWAAVAGVSNVTVVAVDDRDHAMVLRVFESLTGLRPGTLETPLDRTNRSLTLAEVDVIRVFNQQALDVEVDRPLLAKLMRYGASGYIKQREPDPSEARIETPQWALDRATEVAREMVARIAASGVRVVGDLEAMAVAPPPATATGATPEPVITPEVAARTAVGVLVSAGLARGRAAVDGGTSPDLTPDEWERAREPATAGAVDRSSMRQMGAVLVRRGRVAAGRGVHRLRRGR
jgi:hypothetical protein